MKFLILSLVLSAALASPVSAQTTAAEHSAHHPASATAADDMVDGEIRKIDKGSAKITIKHGEIKRLDMPPMTMVFQVKEPTLLNKVKAGDKVRFRAEQTPGGFVVTAIDAAK
jgi:Cu(I)/Ag(I) efflux system periplasmic protein CusF